MNETNAKIDWVRNSTRYQWMASKTRLNWSSGEPAYLSWSIVQGNYTACEEEQYWGHQWVHRTRGADLFVYHYYIHFKDSFYTVHFPLAGTKDMTVFVV